MMGKKQRQGALFSYHVNLEARVRQDHPLREIHRRIDFAFIRREVRPLYGEKGNVSVDPEVILRMMFLLFYYDVKSERELMRTIPERLDWMWFLGYGLDEEIPDHSVLSKARRRWGAEVFEGFFVRTILQCVQAGLVDGTKLHLDGSLVAADASKNSVVKGPPELIAALRRAYQREEQKLEQTRWEEPESAEETVADDPPGTGGGEPAIEAEALCEGSDSEASPRYESVNKGLMSRTDPDAPVVRKGWQDPRPRYKNHRAVDNAYGVITAMKTTPGDVEENAVMMELIEQHERHTQETVQTAVADTQYGTVENFRACQARGIRSHMADLAATSSAGGRRKGIFPETEFVYDAKTDTYRCPAGQTLRRRRHKKTRRAYEYTAGPKVCTACPLKAQCTRSKAGRSVKRHEGHEAIEAARAQSHSRAAKRDRRRRKHLMEGSFADAANRHHFKRSRWRGLWRQRIQDWVIAAIQNVRILLRHGPKRMKGAARSPAGTIERLVCSLPDPLQRHFASQRPPRPLHI